MRVLSAYNLDELHGIKHAFFRRTGGVSEGIYASLNCGPGSGDDLEHVRENRRRVASYFGLEEPRVLTLHQTHSAQVHVATDTWPMLERPEGDALVTVRPRLILGVLTADCAPVLLADPVNGVVGAAHAGWKGALGGVLEATVAAMQEIGAMPGSIVAAIGPCIGQASYEVGEEFLTHFVEQEPSYARYFAKSWTTEKHRFNLKYFVKDRLQHIGISSVSMPGGDTCVEEHSYYSYRRACLRGETAYGRQISCISLEH